MQRNLVIVVATVAVAAVAGIGYYSGHRSGLREARRHAATASVGDGAIAATGASATGATRDTSSVTHAAPTTRKMLNSAASNGSAVALPPPGTPLAEIFDELKARADAGDADAASRLFQDLQHCAEAQRLGQFLPAVANRMLNGNLPSSPDEIERSDRQLDRVQRGL